MPDQSRPPKSNEIRSKMYHRLQKLGAKGNLGKAKHGEHAPRQYGKKYATGGGVGAVGGGDAPRNLGKPGKKAPSKGGKTSINIINLHGKGDAAGSPLPPGPGPMAAMMPPPKPPMMPPPGAGGPPPPGVGGGLPPPRPPMAGGPPGGLPPGIMPRKDGGRVIKKLTGGAVNAKTTEGTEPRDSTGKHDGNLQGGGEGKKARGMEGYKVKRAMGGKVGLKMKYGAASGEGREEKIRKYGK